MKTHAAIGVTVALCLSAGIVAALCSSNDTFASRSTPAPIDEDSLQRELSPQLEYRVTVPANVPKQFEWCGHKVGRILVDGPSLYRHRHRWGWDLYLFYFLTDKIDVTTDDSKLSKSIMFFAGPCFENIDPRNDGYVQCRQSLRVLVNRFGADEVRRAISARLEKINSLRNPPALDPDTPVE